MSKIHKFVSRSYFSTRLVFRPELFSRYSWFKSNETKSQSDIHTLQWELLSKLLVHADKNVPYYQELFKNIGVRATEIHDPKAFAQLPLLQKKDIRENFERLVAVNIPKEKLARSGTGGSTGTPVAFYHDTEYARDAVALKWRNLGWTGWQLGDRHVAIWGSSFDVKLTKRIDEKISNYFSNRVVLPAFEMSNATMSDWIKKLQNDPPTIIEGYNSPLVAFARYAIGQNTRLDNLGVKAVINAAETLYEPQRQFLENAFDCKVFNRYGGRELSDVAFECNQGNLHISDDWVYVEVVNEDGQLVKPGKMGQIVLTGLFSGAMPFIRYAVEDVGSLPMLNKKCSCGLPFSILDKLEGRVQDLIVLPGGGVVSGVFFPHLFKDFDILQFQVVQYTPTQLEVNIVPGPGLCEDQLSYLKNKIQIYTLGINITIRKVESIPVSASGKFRYTISHVAGAQALRNA